MNESSFGIRIIEISLDLGSGPSGPIIQNVKGNIAVKEPNSLFGWNANRRIQCLRTKLISNSEWEYSILKEDSMDRKGLLSEDQIFEMNTRLDEFLIIMAGTLLLDGMDYDKMFMVKKL